MAQYDPTFLMIKKRQRKRGTRKHARAVPPCLPSLIRIQSECGGFSGVRRQASGNQGLLFLFDLAGSLALKKIWRINVSEALYGSEACGTMRYGSIYRPDSVAPKSMSEEAKRRQQKRIAIKFLENKKDHMLLSAHLSMPALFMIVSFPDEAACTICCSTDLFILALSAYNNKFQSDVPRAGGNEVEYEPCAWLPA